MPLPLPIFSLYLEGLVHSSALEGTAVAKGLSLQIGKVWMELIHCPLGLNSHHDHILLSTGRLCGTGAPALKRHF
jgi:hypothetical protein